jgi:NAD(P)-dependent dehydrogenase (short-subunit alcohol dehydrogenase family)
VGRDYNFPDTPTEPARRDIARAGLRILEWDHQQRRAVGNRIASAIDSGIPDATLFARIDTPHNGDRVCVGVHEMGATKVALVTGASSGIGKEIAKALVAGGWRVIGTGRTPPRIASAEAEIRAAAAQGGAITMLAADLSLMGQAAGLARQVLAMTNRLDLLINNAGGMTAQKVITAEGLEANFAGNHLGPFLLTRELLPLLTRTAAGEPYGAVRILNTASDASEMIPALDLEDMQGLANFDPGRAYCSGKLANVLLERFPTILTRPDRALKSAGQEWRAAGAGCPCKHHDEASGLQGATGAGAGRNGLRATLLVTHDALHRSLLAPCPQPVSAPSGWVRMVGNRSMARRRTSRTSPCCWYCQRQAASPAPRPRWMAG